MRERFKNYVNTLATIKLDEVCVVDLYNSDFCLKNIYFEAKLFSFKMYH